MANMTHDPAVSAIKDAQVSGALAEIVQQAIEDADRKRYDPYRTTIHFLIALIAFCLSVIVGIFNALPDPPVSTYTLTYRMLGGVLAWIAMTALVATFCAAFAQLRKSHTHEHEKKPWKGERAILMVVPALFGGMAVIYCVGVGLAMLNDNKGPLKSLCVICKLWPF